MNEKDLFKLVDDLNNNRFRNIEDYIVSYDELIDCYKSICDFLDYIGKLKNEVKIEVKEEADQDEPELLC